MQGQHLQQCSEKQCAIPVNWLECCVTVPVSRNLDDRRKCGAEPQHLVNNITCGQLTPEKQGRPEDLVVDLRAGVNCRNKWTHFEPHIGFAIYVSSTIVHTVTCLLRVLLPLKLAQF